MYAIETKDLSFNYKKKPLLESLDLKIPTGSIYGYLGKNGAGKSTTIKLLLGLLPALQNTIYHNGLELNSHKREILSMVGSLVESPAYYGNLTGYENLLYLKNIYGCNSQKIYDVLQKVNLMGDKDKMVKRYSSGMKQRLGIAMALLYDPNTLILDEPLNGLDPEGVYEIRELIIDLKKEGKTILLSSHILSEIQKTCTHVGILHDGRLCYQGTLVELMNNVSVEINIQSNDILKIQQICMESKILINAIEQNNILITLNKGEQKDFMNKLDNEGVKIQKFDSVDKDLEEIYLNLTKR
ncbi:ABC transporter ATP-binding protein [Macellibacteroides fermentans]|uniref:ABC-2 type transport system ATP-binding protein n=1 Tax=Macellibacteroides fermentans TaxID=879969 RepID=A0A8E1ZUZ7_9PORP|nr:ATP-binding cassette domain-containing protein [Macellibacteroides fermentans]NYI48919.1 ABC-2 type transport system ATP-binding protein [Macellibacteroides fermentans]